MRVARAPPHKHPKTSAHVHVAAPPMPPLAYLFHSSKRLGSKGAEFEPRARGHVPCRLSSTWSLHFARWAFLSAVSAESPPLGTSSPTFALHVVQVACSNVAASVITRRSNWAYLHASRAGLHSQHVAPTPNMFRYLCFVKRKAAIQALSCPCVKPLDLARCW